MIHLLPKNPKYQMLKSFLQHGFSLLIPSHLLSTIKKNVQFGFNLIEAGIAPPEADESRSWTLEELCHSSSGVHNQSESFEAGLCIRDEEGQRPGEP
jgi:hypothetical protein